MRCGTFTEHLLPGRKHETQSTKSETSSETEKEKMTENGRGGSLSIAPSPF
jgi:hypothetical protein